jgi:glutamine amidotransferase
MKIAIIKYNAGNPIVLMHSKGLECLHDYGHAEEIIGADKVIFPGVGEASSAMKY